MFDNDSKAGKRVGRFQVKKREGFRYALIGVCWCAKLEAAHMGISWDCLGSMFDFLQLILRQKDEG